MPARHRHKTVKESRPLSVVLFVLLALVVFILFPKEHHFSYDFKKGSPWMHDDVIAPFDFAVQKTPEEIQHDRDSIGSGFVAYYYTDTSVLPLVKAKTLEKLEQLVGRPAKNLPGVVSVPLSERLPAQFYEKNAIFVSTILEQIYAKGVIEIPDTSRGAGVYMINLLSGNESRSLDARTAMYSPKAASQYLADMLKDMNRRMFQPDSLQLLVIDEICRSVVFSPNLIRDEKTTASVLDEEYKNLEVASGKVQKGELIVQRGHIVDNDTYRILLSLEEEYRNSNAGVNFRWLYMGYGLLIVLILLVYYLHLNFNFRNILLNPKQISFIILQMMLMVLLTYLFTTVWDINLYLIPFVIFPILVYTFYNNRIALVSFWMLVLLISFFAPNSFEFIFIQIVAGMIVLFSLRSIQRRFHLFVSVLLVLASYSVSYLGFSIIREGSLESIKWINFLWFGGNAFLLLTLFPMMYLYEKLFGFLSDVTLLELSDTNSPALRALAEKAPGTFQHSMQVANLAESVIRKIGGHALLVRTGALYHDIGKTGIPEYFIENQHGRNIHDGLKFEDSAKIIIDHVYKGVEAARKFRIPAPITDFIKTHHGTTMTRYFFNSFINENPGAVANPALFTYPGPKPVNIETAVVMMADAVEASARSLKSYTQESISNLVNKIIDTQVAEKQFENVNITFKNISEAKQIFIEKLMNIYHTRIEYPEINPGTNV